MKYYQHSSVMVLIYIKCCEQKEHLVELLWQLEDFNEWMEKKIDKTYEILLVVNVNKICIMVIEMDHKDRQQCDETYIKSVEQKT